MENSEKVSNKLATKYLQMLIQSEAELAQAQVNVDDLTSENTQLKQEVEALKHSTDTKETKKAGK